MKRSLVIAWLLILSAAICFMFWHWEFVYNQPTIKPDAYVDVQIGSHIKVPLKFDNHHPVFLHFFNPGCPCSRFNIKHFKTLVKQYGDQVNFVMVVMTSDKSYTQKWIREKYDLNIPVLADSSLAAAVGVYSTPQAVIINSQGELYYRGNYNKSRYCTNRQSNYAQITLDSLLNNSRAPALDLYAFTAFGCRLPACSKN